MRNGFFIFDEVAAIIKLHQLTGIGAPDLVSVLITLELFSLKFLMVSWGIGSIAILFTTKLILGTSHFINLLWFRLFEFLLIKVRLRLKWSLFVVELAL